jgi:capsule polysaccharide export protein KpsE/RkpR
LENSYFQTLNQLEIAENKFSQYQINHKLYLLDEQTKLIIETISELEKTKIELEIQKKYLETFYQSNRTEIDALSRKINALQRKINSLKYDTLNVDIPLNSIPDKGLEYLRLLREVKIREKILEFIIPQLENARLEEEKRSAELQILDVAKPPDYKAKPKRITVIFVTCFFFFIFSIFYVLVKGSLQKRHENIKLIFQDKKL